LAALSDNSGAAALPPRGAPIERIAVLKRDFRASQDMTTTVPNVKMKMMLSCTCFNLMQVLTLQRLVQVKDLDESRK
jgi:hypothetical protein